MFKSPRRHLVLPLVDMGVSPVRRTQPVRLPNIQHSKLSLKLYKVGLHQRARPRDCTRALKDLRDEFLPLVHSKFSSQLRSQTYLSFCLSSKVEASRDAWPTEMLRRTARSNMQKQTKKEEHPNMFLEIHFGPLTCPQSTETHKNGIESRASMVCGETIAGDRTF